MLPHQQQQAYMSQPQTWPPNQPVSPPGAPPAPYHQTPPQMPTGPPPPMQSDQTRTLPGPPMMMQGNQAPISPPNQPGIYQNYTPTPQHQHQQNQHQHLQQHAPPPPQMQQQHPPPPQLQQHQHQLPHQQQHQPMPAGMGPPVSQMPNPQAQPTWPPGQPLAPHAGHPGPNLYQPSPYMQQQQPSRQMKLDPHAMPSAVQLINDEIKAYEKTGRQLNFTAPASLPPLVTTLESQQLKMSLQDGGCVRPCHMRSTIYQVPVSKDLLDASGLEFAIVVKPFDEFEADNEADRKIYVPLSTSEIVRCNRCKAYVNPFSRNAQCCICKFNFDGVQELDGRPELHFGSYEFRVTKEYYRDQIAEYRRPHIIFAIEMTASSRHLVHYLAKNLASVIKDHFPIDFLYESTLPPLVGFLTYNSKITLYDVMNGGHAYVISDMTTVTDCASTSKFLVDPIKNFDKIEKFLASLVSLSNEQAEYEQQTVLGPVIEAALKTCAFSTNNYIPEPSQEANSDSMLNSKSTPKVIPNPKVIPTGKVYLLHSSLPTYGDETTPGRLSMKRNIDEMKRGLGTENESKILAVEGKYYSKLAEKCINDYASGIELFLFPPHPRAYLNIATLGDLPRMTGTGVINKYHLSSMDNFIQDLKFSLRSTMGFDASMRVRTSTGISPVRYIGNFNNAVGSNLEMAAVNSNSNFVVQMKYDDKVPENDLVVVQFAMIYTSVCGERRVRVHNLALSTCQALADLYKSACCDTLVNVLVRDTIDKMRSGSLTPKIAKEQLTSKAINILAAYRKHCTENQLSTLSQLILPEGLKLLPVYLCGALKCDAIDGGIEMFPDDKVMAQLNLLGALPSTSQVTVYPRMYSIEACQADDEANEYGLTAVLTRCCNLAIEEGKACYVLENGNYLFIYFSNNELGQSFLANVYGAHKDSPDLTWEHRLKDSSESLFLEELVEQIVEERRRSLKICVVRQGRDKHEPVFKSFLYEDKKRPEGAAATKLDNASYVDILVYLHTEIKAKMSQ